MATSPPTPELASNFEESTGIDRSNSESTRMLILGLNRCQDLEKGQVDGTPIQDYLSNLYALTCKPDQHELQLLLVRTVTEILLNMGLHSDIPRRVPKDGQVEAIQRIVYRIGDTILLARTGYGKSIVFQAISVLLLRKITIQIVPLSKLGEEQCNTIATFPNTSPILIDGSLVKVGIYSLHYSFIIY